MAKLLKEFVYEETLNSDSLKKSVILLGKISDQDAIVTLEKLPFEASVGQKEGLGLDHIVDLDSNDIYSWSVATLKADTSHVKANIIYPATETHIKKYGKQNKRMVRETPELYRNVVVPYIETMKGSRIQWVYNILHHGAEADRVIYRDDDAVNGFVLLPDIKTLESLYLVAIVLRSDIGSIRDLTREHIPFLRQLRETILTVVPKQFAVDRSQLKLFFHYQPSYYHLHLHVANVNHEMLDFGKSILLDAVIDQLQFLEKGYSQCTLTYMIGENHYLYENGLDHSGY